MPETFGPPSSQPNMAASKIHSSVEAPPQVNMAAPETNNSHTQSPQANMAASDRQNTPGSSTKYMLPSGEVIAFSKLVQVPDSTPETYSRFDNGVAMVEVISKEDFDNFRRDEMTRYTGLYNKACLDVHSHAEGVIGQSRRVINEELDQFQRLQMSAASDARACLKATSNSLQFLFRPDSGWKAMMKELKEVVENLISYGSGADREARAAWRKDREEFRLNMTREEVVLKTQLATEQDRREQEIEKNNFFENHSFKVISPGVSAIPSIPNNPTLPRSDVSATSDGNLTATDPVIALKQEAEVEVEVKSEEVQGHENSSSIVNRKDASNCDVDSSANGSKTPKLQCEPKSARANELGGGSKSMKRPIQEDAEGKGTSEHDRKRVKESTERRGGYTLEIDVQEGEAVLKSIKKMVAACNVQYKSIVKRDNIYASEGYLISFADNTTEVQAEGCFEYLKGQTVRVKLEDGSKPNSSVVRTLDLWMKLLHPEGRTLLVSGPKSKA